MLDLIANVIGWGSVIIIIAAFYYADDLGDGNVERLTKEKDNETSISRSEKPDRNRPRVQNSMGRGLHLDAGVYLQYPYVVRIVRVD